MASALNFARPGDDRGSYSQNRLRVAGITKRDGGEADDANVTYPDSEVGDDTGEPRVGEIWVYHTTPVYAPST